MVQQHAHVLVTLVASLGICASLADAKIERFERVPTFDDLGADLPSSLPTYADTKWLTPQYDNTDWTLWAETPGWETKLALDLTLDTITVSQTLWNNRKGTNFMVKIDPNDQSKIERERVVARIECAFKDGGADRSKGACSWFVQGRLTGPIAGGLRQYSADETNPEDYRPLAMVDIERQGD